MTDSIIVLTDLQPLEPEAGTTLPRLPAVERLLARADRIAAGVSSWRHWVHAAIGWPLPGAELPAGALLAAATPGLGALALPPARDDGTLLLAAPVHLVAALDHVRLGAAGILPLSVDEGAGLAQAFNAEFATTGAELLPAAGALLLRLRDTRRVQTTDPALLAGRDIGAALPRGEAGPDLQRLMTEMQMWLHQRTALVGATPARFDCNCLWPWGGAPLPAPSARLRALHTTSDDAYLRALAAVIARSATTDREAPPVAVTTLSLAVLGRQGAEDVFAAADLACSAAVSGDPLAAAATGVQLCLAGNVFRIARRQSWRVWRRLRPWWEQLQ